MAASKVELLRIIQPPEAVAAPPIGQIKWGEPKPIQSALLPVAPFDLHFLPETIGAWVADIADRMQCPPDFVGIPAMVALGSVLGRKVGIRPQRRTDWLETANLWGLIIGRPGAMKSPATAEALKPLHRLEAKAREAYGE
jgi:putative DNA primase/helicase